MASRIDTLFQKFIDTTCTQQEYDELMDLLQQHAHDEHVRAMLLQVYQASTRALPSGIYVDQHGELQTAGNIAIEEAPPPLPDKRNPARMAMIILALTVIGIWGWYHRKGGSFQQQLLTETFIKKITERADQKYLLLPDSTQVWLNVASSIEFPEEFSEHVREVYLTGEAFFDVKHAGSLPFIVHTGKVATRVLGTSFNIKAYADHQDVEVSVKRGKVQVSKNGQVAILLAGESVKMGASAANAQVTTVNKANIGSWTTGILHFEHAAFGDIIKDFERTYNVYFEWKDSATKAASVTTSFPRDIGVEQALRIICDSTGSQWYKENGEYILSSKPL